MPRYKVTRRVTTLLTLFVNANMPLTDREITQLADGRTSEQWDIADEVHTTPVRIEKLEDDNAEPKNN